LIALSSVVRRQEPRGRSRGLLAAVLTVCVIAGRAAALPTSPQAAVKTEPPAQGGAVAQALGQRLEALRERLRGVAQSPELKSALRTPDPEQLRSAERALRMRFPGARTLHIVAGDWADLVPNAPPDIDFADIDMIRRAQEGRLAPAAEVHRVGRPDQHVALVQPVLDDSGSLLGTLVVSLPWAAFQSLLEDAPGKGSRLQVVQTVDGREDVVAGARPERSAQPAAKWVVPGSAWKLLYWSPQSAGGRRALPLLIGVAAVLLAAVALAYWLLMRRSRREPHWLPFPKASATMDSDPGAAADSSPLLAPQGEGGSSDMLRTLARAAQTPADAHPTEAPEIPQTRAKREPEHPTGRVPASIFRAYDIRGVVGQTFTPAIVYEIGRAIGSAARDLGEQQIVVGRDGRLSGPSLCHALVNGLASSGLEVTDVGMVPTPVLYYASAHLQIASAVMVTGSHNPPEYNGLKMVLGGETLAEDGIQRLRRRIESEDLRYLPPVEATSGGPLSTDIIAEYIGRVLDKVVLPRPLHIVVDCGNGAAALVAPKLLRALGCTVTELFCEVDGRFPNHHPDPSQPENLAVLTERIRKEDADLGLAFDGDGDRLGVVDDQSRIIWPDRQMMLYAADVLARHPGATIIYDVKCTASLDGVIRNRGGEPLMWKTGHSLIKAKMRETGALLGGEMSGHIFFRDDWYGFDDAIYTAARLLQILARQPRAPSAVFSELPNAINTPELRVDLDEGQQFALMTRALAQVQAGAEQWFPGANLTTIDGLRADFPDRWGLVRASNTTPCLVLRFEAFNAEGLARIEEQFRTFLLGLDPSLRLPF
jgi:phosphomannomutase / phosphoglucomutase